MRLDQILNQKFPEVSRSRWTRLIDQKMLLVDSVVAHPSKRLKTGQSIHCERPELLKVEAFQETGELFFSQEAPAIIYEDDELLVVNKPPGLAVHPGSGVALGETLVGFLLSTQRVSLEATESFLKWDDELVEEQRPGIVHRLDRGTSGALVVAKNPRTHEQLSTQFADRTAGRLYWAVVAGQVSGIKLRRPQRLEELILRNPCPAAFKINEKSVCSFVSYLERDPATRVRFQVSKGLTGKKAISHFKVATETLEYSLLELKLGTGRTHQIRVHLSFLGFPVIGDVVYGSANHSRLMLHAHQLEFTHPQKGLMKFAAPWPAGDLKWLDEQGLILNSSIESDLLL